MFSLSLLFTLSIFLSPSAIAEDAACLPVVNETVSRVDMNRVRRVWLNWNNRIRRRVGVPRYTIDTRLNTTATEWSQQAALSGELNHKRSPDAAYYDYTMIEQWFTDRGLTFTNVNRATFTENIGWGTYRCADDEEDCTRAVIRAIHSTYRFYLAERNQTSQAHWKSMIKPEFERIGIGLALDETAKRYYLTIHYATDITSNPQSCAANLSH